MMIRCWTRAVIINSFYTSLYFVEIYSTKMYAIWINYTINLLKHCMKLTHT